MAHRNGRFLLAFGILWGTLAWTLPALGIDIPDVQPAALDQPRVNVLLQRTVDGLPLDFYGIFNIEAFYDTGASGLLLSANTAEYLGVTNSYYPDSNGVPVIYEDVGVAGSAQFHVSETLYIRIAKYHPDADIDNISTYNTVYNQSFGPEIMQIGPLGIDPDDPLLGNLDVFGIPAMAGKVVVMDPKPLDTLDPFTMDLMRTYVYNPGTPYQPATADSEPGIPVTNRHLRLSYASFDQFTTVTPAGATGPTLAENPFIGANPVAILNGSSLNDTTPGVTIGFDGHQTTGSFLLDTGAAATIISKPLAENLHVRYVSGTEGTENPVLELFDPANPSAPGTTLTDQFQLTIGGIGGTTKVAGFFLDSMLLKTMEGDPGDNQDPNHLLFQGAPVLVADITVMDPITEQTLTLDGIFGMNYMVASAMIIESYPFPEITDLTAGNFNWVVFDQPNGILGLETKAAVPTSFAVWSGAGSADPSPNTNWSNSANWENGAPNPADGVRFALPQIVSVNNFNDFTVGTSFNGIVLSGQAAFNLQGHAITLCGSVVNISTQTQTISLDMELSGATRTFDTYSADMVLQGRISGTSGLCKTGTGMLTLTASNTYTGGTTISEGILALDGGDLDNLAPITVADDAVFKVIQGTPMVGDISGLGATAVSGEGTVLTAKSIYQSHLSIGPGAKLIIASTSAKGYGTSAVPEPSSLVLLGIGSLSLLAYAWRRHSMQSRDQRSRI